MDELEFIAMLQSEENGAVGFFNSEVAADQEKALRYYHGEPFGNEEEGHSTVISRDVASTVDGIMPDLIRVFVSGDNVVEFNPSKEGDEAFAAQATDYINHIFFKDNDGFSITHDWAKDGLLNKIGVVKAYWEETLDQRRETYEGLTENALMSLSQEVEIIEATLDDQTGLSDVTVIRSEDKGRVRIENIPPEEFLVQPNTRTLIDADYVAHKSQKSLSDLVEMGFDKDLIDSLPAGEGSETAFDPRASERYKDEDIFGSSVSLDQSMRKVWVLEEYVRCDYDGDGIAELRNFQIEPETLFDLYDNYLKYRPNALAKLDKYQASGLSLTENLTMNIAYAVAAARLQYLRAPETIPSTLEGQAAYWKKYWNTEKGKGTTDQYINHFKQFNKGH